MKGRFAAQLARLRSRHTGGLTRKLAEARLRRQFVAEEKTQRAPRRPRPKYFSPRAKDANIVLVMVEDLRRDHVVGNEANTPHLDALAARHDAVSFDRAFAQAT
jgi:membrane-anchored protein YejM (alkaline phosphatase superfamily)